MALELSVLVCKKAGAYFEMATHSLLCIFLVNDFGRKWFSQHQTIRQLKLSFRKVGIPLQNLKASTCLSKCQKCLLLFRIFIAVLPPHSSCICNMAYLMYSVKQFTCIITITSYSTKTFNVITSFPKTGISATLYMECYSIQCLEIYII